MLIAMITYISKSKKKVVVASDSNKGDAKLHTLRTGPLGYRMQM